MQLQLRTFGIRPGTQLTDWLLPHAIENDRLVHLAELKLRLKDQMENIERQFQQQLQPNQVA